MLWKKIFHNKGGSSWSPFFQISRSWFGCCFQLSPHLCAFTSCVHSLLRFLCKSGHVLTRCKALLLKPSALTTDPDGGLPEAQGQQGRWLSPTERPGRVLWTWTKSFVHRDRWAVSSSWRLLTVPSSSRFCFYHLLSRWKLGHIAQIAQSENTLNKRLSSPSYLLPWAITMFSKYKFRQLFGLYLAWCILSSSVSKSRPSSPLLLQSLEKHESFYLSDPRTFAVITCDISELLPNLITRDSAKTVIRVLILLPWCRTCQIFPDGC